MNGKPAKRGFLGRPGRERRFNIGCLIVLVLIAAWLVVMRIIIEDRVRSRPRERSESGANERVSVMRATAEEGKR
jgi:hypothetical protein